MIPPMLFYIDQYLHNNNNAESSGDLKRHCENNTY